ncbi:MULTISPECIES: acyltransferase [unclassified Mesorhizobium]|uniref:acyltransferase family protein n=1 Tax=unclassified Mesorhizobium TaxID=325217 RepID=UPI001674FE61|nr:MULTISPECIES: acyltransferase [unclassified Mesorhizobium]
MIAEVAVSIFRGQYCRMGGGRLYGLDALRGVAAIAVVVHHLASTYHLPKLPLNPFLAVDLFFILSGFVMARTYEARLRTDLSTVGFIGLRYRRLFIPLAIGSTIGAAWVAAVYGLTPYLLIAYGLILCFLPLPQMIGPNAFPLNVPAWSLFVEIVCNALHGAVFSKLSNMHLLAVAGASGLIFLATFLSGLSIWGPGFTSILWLMPRELSCYLAGILVFRNYGDKPLGNWPLLAVAAFALALGAASINSTLEVLSLFACPFIVRASLAIPRTQWAIWAGALSYPFYATHVPVIQASRMAGFPWSVALTIAACVAIAVTLAFETRRQRHKTSALAQTVG